MANLIAACWLLCSNNAFAGRTRHHKPTPEHSEKFTRLALTLLYRNDEEGLRQLIDYAGHLDIEGEQDLLRFVASNAMPSKYARMIFDCLLESKNHATLAEALDWLGEGFPWICKDEASKLKRLAGNKDKQLKENALGLLQLSTKDYGVDPYQDVGRNQ